MHSVGSKIKTGNSQRSPSKRVSGLESLKLLVLEEIATQRSGDQYLRYQYILIYMTEASLAWTIKCCLMHLRTIEKAVQLYRLRRRQQVVDQASGNEACHLRLEPAPCRCYTGRNSAVLMGWT